jgi:hypothetical protein
MILIVSTEDDLHARVVESRIIAKGGEAKICNLTWFPWKMGLAWSPTGTVSFNSPSQSQFTITREDVIWWRRFSGPTTDPSISDPAVRQFCIGEAREAIRGIVKAHPRILNRPEFEAAANAKLGQLEAAQSVGLSIPPTLVTNDPLLMRDFVRSNERVVIKTIRCDYPHSLPTREVTLADFDGLNVFDLAPIILQKLIICDADIRVCVMGDQVFSAELVRDNANTAVDWRFGPQPWKAHKIPDTLEKLLISLLRRLQLYTGSIDLRLTPEGEYVFLEVNPGGQFLFLEVDAGHPVTDCLADLLLNPDSWPKHDQSLAAEPSR